MSEIFIEAIEIFFSIDLSTVNEISFLKMKIHTSFNLTFILILSKTTLGNLSGSIALWFDFVVKLRVTNVQRLSSSSTSPVLAWKVPGTVNENCDCMKQCVVTTNQSSPVILTRVSFSVVLNQLFHMN